MTVRSRSDGPDLINLATGGARVTVAGGRQRRWRGMPRSGENKSHGKGISLPSDGGGRGEHGGKVGDGEVDWFAGNSSPELQVAAVVFDRGRTRRSEGKKNTGVCQTEAQDRIKQIGKGERKRGGRSSPE